MLQWVAEFDVCAFTQIFTTDNGAALDPVSYLEMLSLGRQARERREELSQREIKRVQVIKYMISQGSQDLMELSSDGFPCHRDSQHSLRQHELSDLHTIFTFTEFGHSYDHSPE